MKKKAMLSFSFLVAMLIAVPAISQILHEKPVPINFVTVLRDVEKGATCYRDLAESTTGVTDAGAELAAGMAFAASNDFYNFRGILISPPFPTKVLDDMIPECIMS